MSILIQKKVKVSYHKSLLIIIFFAFSNLSALAMQTIFNVPSADVTPKDDVYLLQEAQFNGSNPGAFFNGTTFGAVGIGHNTELDTTLFNVSSPASQNIAIGAGFKSAMPIVGLKDKFPNREFKLTVGTEILFGVEGNGVGNWTYAHLSGRVPKLNTRLTAGISYGTKQVFGQQATAFIAGVEQPVTKKLTLLGDWYSGSEHFAGFLIAGFSYALPKRTTLYAGYQIPNTPQNGNNGFVVQVGKLF